MQVNDNKVTTPALMRQYCFVLKNKIKGFLNFLKKKRNNLSLILQPFGCTVKMPNYNTELWPTRFETAVDISRAARSDRTDDGA